MSESGRKKVGKSLPKSNQTTLEPPKIGRPTLYTDDLAARICAELASGAKLTDICAAEDMPADRTVYRWLAANETFCQQYARAQEDRTAALAEEILDIADDGRNDWMARNHGGEDTGWIANGEALQRSRLRVDTRKWLMSKMAPKKYGDKIVNEHAGSLTLKHEDVLSELE